MATSRASAGKVEQDKVATEAEEEQKHVLQAGWKALFGFTIRKHIPVLLGAMLSAFIAAATMPAIAILYGLIFGKYSDYGASKIDSDNLISSVSRYCVIVTGLALLNWIANSFYFFFFLTFGELQARRARDSIFDALIVKDLAWYDTRETGVAAFLPAIQMHIRDLQLAVSAPFGEAVQSLVQGLAAMGVAFYYCWNLTLIILCTIPLLYIVQAFIAGRLEIRIHEQANKLQQTLNYITNAIQNIEMVKSFNGEAYELQLITQIASLAARLYNRVANFRSMQLGVMQFFTLSVFVQGFWYGSRLVNTGDKTAANVLTTFWAALMAIEGITGFVPQFIVLQKGKIAGARLQLLMKQISASDQCHETRGQLKPSRCPGDIEFRQVTFSYPTRVDEIALRNASLFFPAGETTFVIGRSGSGKSTLGQLLVRFYQPCSGQIFLDGTKLENLDVRWLRETVMLVEQHSVLFNDTIRQNIALGKRGAIVDLQTIQDAIAFATLDPIIRDLPEGLATNVGMKGNSLSGGQRQRMTLARARVRDSPVLVLDESTSALDYSTRATVLEAIRQWRKGKTTIVITHDITQIQPQDFLYLLDNARVVQEGYRKDLECRPGAFQTILASHEEREEQEEDVTMDNLSDYDGYTDELMSLYDDSWRVHSPMRRPMSAIVFGESVLSPFLGRAAESWMENSGTGLEQRATRLESQEAPLAQSSEEQFPATLKARPGLPSSALSVPCYQRLDGRPVSSASQRLYRSRSLAVGPWPTSKEYVSRRSSMASSRPAARYASYPRPLSIVGGQSIRLQTPLKRARKPSLFSKLRHSRRIEVSDGPTVHDDSLSIVEIFKSVWPTLTWRRRLALLGTFICTIIHAASIPVFAWVFAQLLATFYEPGGSKQKALKYALAILVIAIIDGIATWLVFFLSDSVAQSWTLSLKTEAMRRILMQPREFFDQEENSISRIAETLGHFAEEARNLPGRFACIFLIILIMVGISIIWSLIISWQLALVGLAMAPVLYGITQCYNMISSRWESLANDANDVVGQILHETFVNIRTVRCLALEDYFRKKYREATTAATHVGIKRAIYSGSIFGLNFAGVIFVAVLLFWYGGSLISRDVYTVKSIMETFLVLLLSINHVNQMAQYMTQINISRVAGSRLLRLARLPTTSHELTGTTKIAQADDISFTNINFTYPGRKDVQVLHDVSFNIPHGSCTAIVGSSGSGKSTIASLLLKLYQTDADTFSVGPKAFDQSSLSISNHDIKTLHTATLRSRMAIVPQTAIIFPGTIAVNIAYGLSPSSPLAALDNIRAAADTAGISEFIDSLPQGYQTLVGEGGTGLSGGQAQRLAIARALVRNPDILILDEATSALDVAAAGVVRDTVFNLVHDTQPVTDAGSPPNSPGSRSGGFWEDKEWDGGAKRRVEDKRPRKQVTVVIITHARQMMAIADHVIMLDKGRVIEQGSFRDLKRNKGGAFARLLRGENE